MFLLGLLFNHILTLSQKHHLQLVSHLRYWFDILSRDVFLLTYHQVSLIGPVIQLRTYLFVLFCSFTCVLNLSPDDVIKWKHFPHCWPFCAGKSPVTAEFPSKCPVTRSFDFFFNLRLDKRLSKQSIRRWFETPSRSLWRRCNAYSSSSFTSNR